MSKINVAFTVDNQNLDQVAVVIASIVATSSDPAVLRFFIVLDGPADVAEQKLRRWAARPPNLTLVPVENTFAALPQRGHISNAALLRTQLPNALPQLDRVLYLDADVIVRRDIAELYASDLGGMPIGGVADLGIYMMLRRQNIRRDPTLSDYFTRLGLDPRKSQYVNSGVLLMDLQALRKLHFSAAALAFWNERGAEVITMDQCLINTILSSRIGTLDPRWNACGHMIRQVRHHHYVPRRHQPSLMLQKTDPWVIHYTGPDKPWNSAAVWRGGDWWDHAARSGIAWAPVPDEVTRAEPRLMSAWRSVTGGLSYAVSRLYPD